MCNSAHVPPRGVLVKQWKVWHPKKRFKLSIISFNITIQNTVKLAGELTSHNSVASVCLQYHSNIYDANKKSINIIVLVTLIYSEVLEYECVCYVLKDVGWHEKTNFSFIIYFFLLTYWWARAENSVCVVFFILKHKLISLSFQWITSWNLKKWI